MADARHRVRCSFKAAAPERIAGAGCDGQQGGVGHQRGDMPAIGKEYRVPPSAVDRLYQRSPVGGIAVRCADGACPEADEAVKCDSSASKPTRRGAADRPVASTRAEACRAIVESDRVASACQAPEASRDSEVKLAARRTSRRCLGSPGEHLVELAAVDVPAGPERVGDEVVVG